MNSAQIESILLDHLTLGLPRHPIAEVYKYATLPGGKLFRPHLVWSICEDLNPELFSRSQHKKSAHAYLASSVELHHSYTLIHDDLPCMDDDKERRGKPCTHLAYGEWQALLAGDGLLNISYQLLAKIHAPRVLELIRFFSWSLGPKGLIHGQVMDLSQEMTSSLEATVRTHELKTARLIQVAVLGSALLALPNKERTVEKRLWKYSRLLGINFQLIDDLSELTEKNLTTHEVDVNPWLKFPEETLALTMKNLRKFEQLASILKLKQTNTIVKNYYGKMCTAVEENQDQINQHLKNKLDLRPLILLLKNFS